MLQPGPNGFAAALLALGTLLAAAFYTGLLADPILLLRSDAGNLVLTVRDTGVGLAPDAATAGTRFGLRQVRERLAKLYGERAQVALEPAADPEGGTLARIVLPLATPAAA